MDSEKQEQIPEFDPSDVDALWIQVQGGGLTVALTVLQLNPIAGSYTADQLAVALAVISAQSNGTVITLDGLQEMAALLAAGKR